jgi:hypothetical protein
MINTGFTGGGNGAGSGGGTRSETGLRGKNPFMAIRVPTKIATQHASKKDMGSAATVSMIKSIDQINGSNDAMTSSTPPQNTTPPTKAGWELE